MKIRSIRPCSEATEKVIVESDLGFFPNLKRLVEILKSKKIFNTILFFEAPDLLWVKGNKKSIVIDSKGDVTVYSADNINEAVKIIQEIEKIIKLT